MKNADNLSLIHEFQKQNLFHFEWLLNELQALLQIAESQDYGASLDKNKSPHKLQ